MYVWTINSWSFFFCFFNNVKSQVAKHKFVFNNIFSKDVLADIEKTYFLKWFSTVDQSDKIVDHIDFQTEVKKSVSSSSVDVKSSSCLGMTLVTSLILSYFELFIDPAIVLFFYHLNVFTSLYESKTSLQVFSVISVAVFLLIQSHAAL